jgi:hypothetical protein
MRLILTLATSLLMTTSAQAEMPEVCQTHFNQETFDNGRSSGEVISLFHAIQGELNPMVNQDKVQPDKVQPALYFFALFFNEQVASAIRLHRAYLTAQKNLNAGNMLAGYDDSFNMWAAEMRVGLMGPHANSEDRDSGAAPKPCSEDRDSGAATKNHYTKLCSG